MVYIIGVDHLVQYRGPVDEKLLNEFIMFINELIAEKKITLAAEELSEESLRDVCMSDTSTVKMAAESSGIKHVFCDPDDGERKNLGIPYHADVRDMVKKKMGVEEKFILDAGLRNKVEEETDRLSRTFWPAREKHWLSRISGRLRENILFICGHEHVESFRKLLADRGLDSEIIEPFWKRDIFSDYANLGLS
ncbi:MAG: hypothetical protein MUD12_10100 [Spirochaetes bacterium]|jgi:hypothetical protein|nr:hypothetical protein [Spirochaetota bacterium]